MTIALRIFCFFSLVLLGFTVFEAFRTGLDIDGAFLAVVIFGPTAIFGLIVARDYDKIFNKFSIKFRQNGQKRAKI